MCYKSGYLIVKTYEKLYMDYAGKFNLKTNLYAIPRADKAANDYIIRYMGIDRDSLSSYEKSDLLAELRLSEIEKEERSEDDFLFSEEDALDVYGYLDDGKDEYEIIWVRIASSSEIIPNDYKSIGFEPSFFYGDHFSAICDCMVIPRWHGTDSEGVAFLEHFEKLNSYGLFDTSLEAADFLNCYLSFDWTERGDFHIVEIFIK